MIPRRAARRVLLAAALAAILLSLPMVMLGSAPLSDEVRAFLPPEAPSLASDGTLPAPPKVAEHQDEPWHFSADKVVNQHDARYVEAEGNVTLSQGGNTVRADFARYYEASRWVFLKGHVRATWEGDFLEAEEAEFDLASGVGWLKRGKVFLAKPHVFIESDHVEKHAGNIYTFKKATVTRCSGPSPAWSVSAQEGEVNLDGRTRVWHSSFEVKGVPVAYMPYAVLPGGKGRQSGFLPPEMSVSKRLGFAMNIPYYWVINDEMDATFSQNWMSSRGYMQGLELRHAQDANTKGLWRFDWLNDAKVAHTEADEDHRFQGDGLTRPNHDRWWARSKYNGYLGDDPRWKTLVDVDVVSDQNYLREFRSGRVGYFNSNKEFEQAFGRDLAAADSLTRTSTAMVTRSWDNYGVAGKVEYTQNLAYWNGNGGKGKDPTVQRLPELDAFAFKNKVAGTPLEFDGGVKYDYFAREYGDTGSRLDADPTLSLPVSLGFATVIPRAGVRQTFYGLDRIQGVTGVTDVHGNTEENNRSSDNFLSRTTYTTGFDAFSEIYRVFDLDNRRLVPTAENAGESRWMALKHSIIPRLDYTYTPTLTNQSRLPYFDERDRLRGQNLSTFSLTNVLDRRRDRVNLVSDGREAKPGLGTDYLDFLRLRLEQSYDYNEAERTDMTSTYPRRPFRDFTAELTVRPESYLSLTSRSRYSPYLGSVTEHEHFVRLEKRDLGDAFFGLDFLEPVDEYNRYVPRRMNVLRLGGDYYLTPEFILGADFRYDLAAGSSIDRFISLTWRHECFDILFGLEQTSDDTRFEVYVNLFRF